MIKMISDTELKSYIIKSRKFSFPKRESFENWTFNAFIKDDLNQSIFELGVRMGVMTNTNYDEVYKIIMEKYKTTGFYYFEFDNISQGYIPRKWTPGTYEPNYKRFDEFMSLPTSQLERRKYAYPNKPVKKRVSKKKQQLEDVTNKEL